MRAYDRRPLAIGIAGALIVFAVAAADLQITRDELPTSPRCPDASQGIACDPPEMDVRARYLQAADLERGYETRLWIYSITALTMLLAVARLAYRRTVDGRRGEIFRDLGALGVTWFIVGFFATTPFSATNLIDPSFAPLAATAGPILLIAAAGGQSHRDVRVERPSPTAVHKVGLGLVGVALAGLALLWAFAPSPCEGSYYDRAVWIGPVATIAWVAALAGAVCGFIALLARWWVSALVMLVVGPVAGLLAALSAACLS